VSTADWRLEDAPGALTERLRAGDEAAFESDDPCGSVVE
jgi:hypothetical protein